MSPDGGTPLYWINSRAPVRICDLGGWTDTWFAIYGQIINIAVTPGIEVQVAVYDGGEPGVRLQVENYGDDYLVKPGLQWGSHPLLEAAIALSGLPPNLRLEISLHSAAPAGASMGTSAAVCVALLGALDALQPSQRNAQEIAGLAHRVETELLGQQSGIQDQLTAAFGGINFIEMPLYPQARVTSLSLPPYLLWELERRLVVVYLGKAHHSSEVHERVIRGLHEAGPDCPPLEALRRAASAGRDALLAGNLFAFGQAMQANTAAQASLNPALVNDDARQVIEIAQKHGAWGWKVNGAGGEGGTLTLLCAPHAHQQRDLLQAIRQASPHFKILPTALSPAGLSVWRTDSSRITP